MEDVQYPKLPFEDEDGNDQYDDKMEEEEEVVVPDPYQIVSTEFDTGEGGIKSLVSMIKAKNEGEKVIHFLKSSFIHKLMIISASSR